MKPSSVRGVNGLVVCLLDEAGSYFPGKPVSTKEYLIGWKNLVNSDHLRSAPKIREFFT